MGAHTKPVFHRLVLETKFSAWWTTSSFLLYFGCLLLHTSSMYFWGWTGKNEIFLIFLHDKCFYMNFMSLSCYILVQNKVSLKLCLPMEKFFGLFDKFFWKLVTSSSKQTNGRRKILCTYMKMAISPRFQFNLNRLNFMSTIKGTLLPNISVYLQTTEDT